jgi:pyrimidine operon attenuation protein/uracil phosphoribosyltransferase
MSNIILTNQEIEHKIKRIAYQIYETFVDEDDSCWDSKQWIRFAEKIAKNYKTFDESFRYAKLKSTNSTRTTYTLSTKKNTQIRV